ncbi:MAG: permease [Candidatus Pacebacteria bacterium]|nr:permease [Candidatus Paceibacterota bacterium]
MNKLLAKNKQKGVTKFLMAVFVIYLGAALYDFSIVKEAFFDFLAMFIQMIPILAFVFVLMAIVNFYFTPERIKKHLGESSGIKGWIYTMLSGIIISGHAYIFFPLLKDLKDHGMKDSLLAVFLYSKNIKIPFLPVMVYYFGLSFTIVLTIYTAIFSILNGFVVEWLVKRK